MEWRSSPPFPAPTRGARRRRGYETLGNAKIWPLACNYGQTAHYRRPTRPVALDLKEESQGGNKSVVQSHFSPFDIKCEFE
jgi:hypothetical protein